MSVTLEEQGEAAERLRDALPPDWHAGNLQQVVALDGREPIIQWSVEFRWGCPIEGGRTMYYSGGSGIQPSGRMLEVTVTGQSIDDLIAAARHLSRLEPMGRLPWPIEFDVKGRTR